MRSVRRAMCGVAWLAWTVAAVAAEARKPPAGQQPPCPPGQANPLEIQITEQDKGKTFSAAMGKTIVLRLPGNKPAGYSWTIAKQNGDSIRQGEKTDYVPGLNVAGRETQAGAFIFKFQALKPGKTELKLTYGKPGDKKPLNHFQCEVIVKRQ